MIHPWGHRRLLPTGAPRTPDPPPTPILTPTLDPVSSLFPLSEWMLSKGPASQGMESGISLWSWVRVYESDIFSGDPQGEAQKCAYVDTGIT